MADAGRDTGATERIAAVAEILGQRVAARAVEPAVRERLPAQVRWLKAEAKRRQPLKSLTWPKRHRLEGMSTFAEAAAAVIEQKQARLARSQAGPGLAAESRTLRLAAHRQAARVRDRHRRRAPDPGPHLARQDADRPDRALSHHRPCWSGPWP